jgi:hypothetical protein
MKNVPRPTRIAAVCLVVILIFIDFLAISLAAAQGAASKQGPPPTYANEAYGPYAEVKPANPGDNQLFDIWMPSGNGPYPCYIYFHGGGFKAGSKDGTMAGVASADLNAQGVVFFDANYRLGNPKIAYEDAAKMLAFIKQKATRYKIDPEKIFVGGGSAGCMIALNLTYDQKIPGIRGVWTEQVPKPVSIGENAAKLASVKVPVFVIHRDPYPTDNLHSTLKGLQYAEGAWRSGVDAIFIAGAKELNIAMICRPTDPGKYQQCWRNGVWLKDKDKSIQKDYQLPSLGEWIKTTLASSKVQ